MTAGKQLVFFPVKVHKIELSFHDDECQQFILMEQVTFCFLLRGAILPHKEGEGSSSAIKSATAPLSVTV